MPKISIATVPEVKGTGYPSPFDAPCAERVRQRLGDAGGLTDFGVNLMRLPPGNWSSQRHWHSHEDEFVYVLSGEVRYTLRKKDYPLRAGDSLHFDANERHRVVNAGPGPAELIVVGTLPLFDDHQSAFVPTSGESKPKARAKAVKEESKGPTAAQDKPAPAPRKSKSITGKTTKPAAARRRS